MKGNYRLCAFADEASAKLDEQITALRENGLSLIELRGVDGRNVSELSSSDAKECSKRLSDSGIKVWAIGSPIGKINIKDDFGAHFDLFSRMLESALILGAECFRLFSFYEAANEYNEVIERLCRLSEASEGSGIKICHENEKGVFGDTPERCGKLLSAVSGLYAVFDPANFVQCGVDTKSAWEKLKDSVYYLHLKDAKEDGTVVPVGEGAGQLLYIISDFINHGGTVMSVEPHLQEFVGFAELETDAKSIISDYNFPDNRSAFDHAVKKVRELISVHG